MKYLFAVMYLYYYISINMEFITRRVMKKIVLEIEGMSCIGCMNTVRDILMELDGIEEAEIELVPGRGFIIAGDDFHADITVREIMEKSRYRANVISVEPVIE